MLQFLKKPGRRENESGQEVERCQEDHLARIRWAEEQCINPAGGTDSPVYSNHHASRLFLALPDILSDQSCLCYFVQFMETEEAVALIKFWLAVENFRLSAETMIDLQKRTISEKPEEDDKSCDMNGEGRTKAQTEGVGEGVNQRKCDIEDRPLTDDEKSEIIQDKQRAKKLQVVERRDKASHTTTQPLRSKRNSQFQTTVATDAIKIFEKFLCSNSDSWLSDIPATIHSKISLSLCNCDEETLVSPLCFAEAQQFVLERMEREYLKQFLDSGFYCKYCVDILTATDDLRLSDILYSECALFYFMEFLEQQQKRDYLDFWVTATNFRRHSTESCPVTEGRTDAMVLYDKYFSLQATNSLQFSDSIRSQVEERICSAEENVLVACFDVPIRIVEKLFEEFYLERFLASELFYKHLSELMNRSQQANGGSSCSSRPRIQRTQSLTKEGGSKTHRKRNSDGTGEILRRTNSTYSISSQNTLLAMESPPQMAKQLKEADLKIDARMFFNSDLLWKRDKPKQQQQQQQNQTSSLSFGRVNALGRFERDFDWEDPGGEEKKGSTGFGEGLKRVVKKLVHLPEDRVQEELAWQVAEMIVKDVTDITLNGRREGGTIGVGQVNGRIEEEGG